VTPALDIRGLAAAAPPGNPATGPLRGLDLALAPGGRLALVGGAGSGARALAPALFGFPDAPDRVTEGGIRIAGRTLQLLPDEERRALVHGRLALVPGDPAAVFHPGRSLAAQMAALLAGQRGMTRRLARARMTGLLESAGVADAAAALRARPGALHPAIARRAGIARAFLREPAAVVADAPGEGLPPGERAALAALLRRLCRETGAALLLVTPDPALGAAAAERLAVLYAGRTVEDGPAAEILAAPAHPWTQALLAALPRPDPGAPLPAPPPGPAPDPAAPPGGCPFHPRCARAYAGCHVERPALEPLGGGERRVACFRPVAGAPRQPEAGAAAEPEAGTGAAPAGGEARP
jgi:oligopeptide/dipeptide ABC transporter ATP-binding protein